MSHPESRDCAGTHDPTARRLRHDLDAEGRGVHAPAGIAAAALRGGRRHRRQRRTAVAAPIALLVIGAAGLGWHARTVAGEVDPR